jgi:hypothetical protein
MAFVGRLFWSQEQMDVHGGFRGSKRSTPHLPVNLKTPAILVKHKG